MTLLVVWLAEAGAELKEAQAWYENRLENLGERFALAVDATVAAIAENPQQFPAVHRLWRRAGVRRFPYGIIFGIEDHRIVVITCFHASRNPRRWRVVSNRLAHAIKYSPAGVDVVVSVGVDGDPLLHVDQ